MKKMDSVKLSWVEYVRLYSFKYKPLRLFLAH